jgi:GH35 family endo-1,4-beta-xylanase
MEAGYRNSIKFAHEQGIKWRAHPIIWPGEDYMPSRILVQKGKPKKQREMVLSHVKEVMSFVASHNPIAIDLVNEVRVNQYFKENGNPDLVEEVFRLAHDIAPDVPLYVNDYAILNNGGLNKNSIEFYHNWIKEMQGKNVPLGGIGFQGHFGAGLTPPQRVMDILGGFSKYGLPLQITEFDVETYDEEAQAAYTRDILMAAFSEPALNAFIVWGWWEGDHWKKPAAMLREDWSEKLNFKAWRKAVYSDWWTREQGMTDSNGELTIRGFKGDYQIRVGTKVMNATLDDAETVAVIVP